MKDIRDPLFSNGLWPSHGRRSLEWRLASMHRRPSHGRSHGRRSLLWRFASTNLAWLKQQSPARPTPTRPTVDSQSNGECTVQAGSVTSESCLHGHARTCDYYARPFRDAAISLCNRFFCNRFAGGSWVFSAAPNTEALLGRSAAPLSSSNDKHAQR